MQDIAIARASPPDFLEIAALDRVAWRSNRHAEFIPDGEHVWRLWTEHALVLGARDGAGLAGAIVAFPCLSGIWCLHKVFVAEDRRGLGIGTALMAALLSEADLRALDLFLTVDPANAAARRLYEALGFRLQAHVPGYYRPHEDRVVLVRRTQG